MNRWVVAPDEAGERVDKLVGGRLHASRAAVRRLVERGAIRIDGRRARKGERVIAGACVQVSENVPAATDFNPIAEPEAELIVLYQDEDLVALAKPAGMPCHPLAPGEQGTLANALVARFPECATASVDPREGGLAHRLDTGTSGVILAARSRTAYTALREIFRESRAEKAYDALVVTSPSTDQGEIDAPLLPRGRKVAVDPAGRPARTAWTVRTRFEGGWCLLTARSHTGRMHQVRAHLAYGDLPIIGDVLYGGPVCPDLIGHFLHGNSLALPHPRTGERLELRAPLPPDRQRVLDGLTQKK